MIEQLQIANDALSWGVLGALSLALGVRAVLCFTRRPARTAQGLALFLLAVLGFVGTPSALQRTLQYSGAGLGLPLIPRAMLLIACLLFAVPAAHTALTTGRGRWALVLWLSVFVANAAQLMQEVTVWRVTGQLSLAPLSFGAYAVACVTVVAWLTVQLIRRLRTRPSGSIGA